MLNNYFGAVFAKWGWWSSLYLQMGVPYLRTYFYIAWGTGNNCFTIYEMTSGICQGLSVSIMATNRLYAMWNPENYTKVVFKDAKDAFFQFWRSWRLKFAVILQIFLGMTGSLTNFFTDVGFVTTDDGQGLIPKILK